MTDEFDPDKYLERAQEVYTFFLYHRMKFQKVIQQINQKMKKRGSKIIQTIAFIAQKEVNQGIDQEIEVDIEGIDHVQIIDVIGDLDLDQEDRDREDRDQRKVGIENLNQKQEKVYIKVNHIIIPVQEHQRMK